MGLASASYDFLIVGSGIIGLTLARSLTARGYRNIGILEKEPGLGRHSSGRNSGILHAGIYYQADTLRARLCADGARRMKSYADENGLPLVRSGKLILAQTPESLPTLKVLEDRAKAAGVRVDRIDRKQILELEPEANADHGEALFSPETASIDPHAILENLRQELDAKGVALHFGEEVLRVDANEKKLQTTRETIGYGHLINAAGLHADRIAHQMGVGRELRILPFKGLYSKLTPEASARYRRPIYSAPDLRFPFLGVHLTKDVQGGVYVGPTAIPALGRENYRGLKGIEFSELLPISLSLGKMFGANRNSFRSYVFREISHFMGAALLRSARELSPSLTARDLIRSDKVGIRPQLVDTRTMELVMDFRVENGPHSTHVLNAISPAFTASFAFSDWVVERISQA